MRMVRGEPKLGSMQRSPPREIHVSLALRRVTITTRGVCIYPYFDGFRGAE